MAIERDIDALPGERWFPKESTIEEDMKALWGDWGVCSEVDTLRMCSCTGRERKLRISIGRRRGSGLP